MYAVSREALSLVLRALRVFFIFLGAINVLASKHGCGHLQPMSVPRARIEKFLFWDVSKEFPISLSVLH
jgi:hypothetical protein